MSFNPAQELDALINRFFGFLVDEHNFVLRKNSKFSYDFETERYDFETETTRVSIFLERNVVVVGIEPIGEEARKLLRANILPQQLGLSVVAQGLNPGLKYEIVWDEPVLAAMERNSKILKDYCQDILKGNFTKWKDILETIRKRN